jgi:carbonic anhydrase
MKIVNEIITVGTNFSDGNLVIVFADKSVGAYLPTNLHFHAPAEHILDGK